MDFLKIHCHGRNQRGLRCKRFFRGGNQGGNQTFFRLKTCDEFLDFKGILFREYDNSQNFSGFFSRI